MREPKATLLSLNNDKHEKPDIVGEEHDRTALAVDREEPPRLPYAQMTNRVLLERFAPVAIVVDRQMQAVYFHGDSSPYIALPPGEPTRDLPAISRDSIRSSVRMALSRAMAESATVRVTDGYLNLPDGRPRVIVSASPLEDKRPAAHFIVCFEQATEVCVAAHANASESHNEGERTQGQMVAEIRGVDRGLKNTVEELSTVNAQLQKKLDDLEGATNDLSSLLSSTDIAVVHLDRQFRIRRFTPAVRDLLELIPSDIGRPLKDLAKKFFDEDLFTDAKTVLESIMPREKEVKSESGRWYLRGVLPFRTTDDRIGGVVITFVDITRRRVAEQARLISEEDYRLMFQHINEYAIVTLDPSGMITAWSPSSERIFGYSEEEILGQYFGIIFPPELIAKGAAEREMVVAKNTGEACEDGWRQRKDGTRLWASGSLTSLYDGDKTLRGFVKVVRDNTERKAAEEKLNEARAVAEKASEAKDQFLATVSHELRTPLSTILMWAQMLNKGMCDDVQLKEAMEMIQWSAEAQKRLIEDLLDTSRISSGKLRLNVEDTNPSEVVRSAVQAARISAQAKDVELVEILEPNPGFVRADPHRLQQIIWNLVANAVKFTPEHGTVTVSLRQAQESVIFQVTDTGKGIASDVLPRLFTRFSQEDENIVTRGHGGLGLGLSIAKQLAELHGGTITAHSDGRGTGATFTVEMPLRWLRPVVHTAGRAAGGFVVPEFFKNMRVLVVEDDRPIRRALSTALQKAGALVSEAENGLEGLAITKEWNPELIISDIGMPEMNGHQMMEEIRRFEKEEGKRQVPAIAVTAFAKEDDKKKSLSVGFNVHLAKPINIEEFIKVASQICANH